MLRIASALAIVSLSLGMHAAVNVVFERIVSGLDRPVQVVSSHDGSGSLFIAQQSGVVSRLDPQGSLHPFLDISPLVSCCTNGGLLSIAFHPRYAENGRFYLLYVDAGGNTALARYLAGGGAPQLLFVLEQPKDNVPNHHGGTLQFGPDGMLYVSIGDGGAYVKVTNRAQQTDHLLGKLLRIDVDHGEPYSIPADNPFAGTPGARGEIWSFGLRNPWRFSFDRATGELYLGDVGQDSWEEVDVASLAEAKGANFGWPLLEATHCFPPGSACAASGMLLPKLEYAHASGCSVTGGYRYRGRRWPAWDGVYFYGDWCSGKLWAATEAPDGSWSSAEVKNPGAAIVSFGEDDDGELLLVDYNGSVYRMDADVSRRRHAVAH